MRSIIIELDYYDSKSLSKLTFCIILILTFSNSLSSQIVNLPCQNETEATIGLDRKDWALGSTVNHSEASMHNFDLPLNTFGDCKTISEVEISFNIINIDISNLPPDCAPPSSYYINITEGCPLFDPASCDVANLIYEAPNTPLNSQTLNFTSPPEDFPFGGVLGVDIVPVMNVNCTNGQSAISSGGIILDYEICVTVTVIDEMIVTPPDLGTDQNICPNNTTTLDPGTYTSYDWDPNGETSPTIDVGPGNYTVTVTDANGCTGTDDISVFAFPDPNITFDPIAPVVCDNGMVSVSVNENYSAYNWSDSQSGQTVMLSAGMYDVTITDSNNCTAVNSIEITNIDPPNAGIDNFLDACDDGTTYNFDELLLAHDPGGTWSDDDGAGVDVNTDPFAVSFAGVLPGSYSFTYTVPGTTPCPSDEAVITVQVFEQNDAGTSETEQYCADPGTLDFYLLISDPDLGGIWTDINGSGVDLSDPFSVNMNGLTPGTYNYEYLFTANGPCPSQSSTLTIIIIEGADAGSDNETTVCEGALFDLMDLIDGANDSGVFIDTDASGALTGSIVNTSGLAGQSFNFTFLVGSPASPCGEDDAIFTLNIDSSLSAGDDGSDSYCIGGTIDLYDLLSNEDPGGTFTDVDGSGGLSGNILTTSDIVPGTYVYQYVIGDGVTCPQDESEVTLTFLEDPSLAFTINDIVLCEESCEEIQIDFTGNPPYDFPIEVYSSNSDSLWISSVINKDSSSYIFTACNSALGNSFDNDTISLISDSLWYVIIPSLTDVSCLVDNGNDPDTLFITTVSNSIFELDTMACITDTLEINGIQFFDGNATFSDTLMGMFCDSIVTINVEFMNIDTVPFNTTLCSGDSIFIEGIWFNETVPNAEILIDNQTGCDSLVVVDIDFYPPATSTINLFLCTGDSIVVNNTVYNDSNPSGTEILIGQSENGCDSIIDISLSFSDNTTIVISDILCPNEFIIVEGTVYDESNPAGQELVSGPNCDTLLVILLDFYAQADSTVSGLFCPDYSINVNGTTYDSGNPFGVEILTDGSTNGCDSTVTVDLEFYTPIESNYSETLCENDFIEVNGATYDMSNPSGTEILIGASETGCDSTVNVDLSFYPTSTSDFTSTLCDNESIEINGTIYDVSNPNGTEIIIGGSTFGCDSTINVMLEFSPTYDMSETSTLCEGDSIFLEGSWQFTSGIYVDSLQSTDLCDSIIRTEVTFMPCTFVVAFTTSDNACASEAAGSITLTIESQISNTVDIIWTGSSTGTNGITTADDQTSMVLIENLPADMYTVQIIDENGDILWEQSIPVIDLNPDLIGNLVVTDSIDCAGETGTIEFQVSGGQQPYNYVWNPNSIGNNPQASNIQAGDYTVTVTDLNGCMLESSITLTEPSNFTASILILDLSCENSNDGQITIFDINGGEGPFTYVVNDEQLDSNIISDLSAGTYVIEIFDANDCMISFTEELMNGGNANFADYTLEHSIMQGDSVLLDGFISNGNYTFEWINNTQDLSCIDCPSPFASPLSTTIYDLIITDENGCTQSVSIQVTVSEIEVIDVAPNVFTPNGDNNNDEFTFINTDPQTVGMELSIYDRWGNLLHSVLTTDNEISWDGSRNGDDLVSGVYVFKLILQKGDGASEAKFGDVLLLR